MLNLNNSINTNINNRINSFNTKQVFNNNIFIIKFSNQFLNNLPLQTDYFTISDSIQKLQILNYRLKDLSFDKLKIFEIASPNYLKKSIGITQPPIEPFTINITFYELPDLSIYKQFFNLITTDFSTLFDMDIYTYSSSDPLYQLGYCHVVGINIELPQSYENIIEITTNISIQVNILL